jgi:hypothetical protein
MGLLSFHRRPAPPASLPGANRLLEIASAIRRGGPPGLAARPDLGGARLPPGARRGASPGIVGLLAGLGVAPRAGAHGSLLPGRGRRR